ncbi:pimeloyl-ACP methyl ester carboxylesterase [Nocardiopsis sp. Huas11]|uniref:alpha/beta fold hydrolase n=1 Tax=Nocardiopsis sp. Huas11 TaxID=2183912 RepID=UPI000EB1A84C|nr:alpha/beta hydrolase [Nocardiopsis sp. Huas11]RKS05167.1 pimeloyl-ACP methyl ester carboxylesterase [Nocardiopsis sp. Huas11]
MTRIDIGHTVLGYEEAGEGPAVVLVHAAAADRRMWDHAFTALAGRYRVVRYDWRGYGESDDAEGPVAHYRDLLALLDALDIGRAALVGSSMGGAHAVDAALVAPDRVGALALVCPGMTGRAWPPEFVEAGRRVVAGAVAPERMAIYRAGNADPDPADVAAMAEAQARFMVVGPDRVPEDLSAQAWERALLMYRALFRRAWSGPPTEMVWPDPPAEGRLTEIGVPVLVVKGLSDVPQVQDVAAQYAAGIPGARLLEMPDTGHLPPVEHPQVFTAALTEFLADAAPSR